MAVTDADARAEPTARRRSMLALLLLVPAPTVGVVLGMIVAPGTPLGSAGFALAKLWMLLLPAAWHLFVERQSPSLSPARRGGFGVAAGLGVAIGAVIIGAYALLGPSLIDAEAVREVARTTGIARAGTFIGLVAYWVLVNSVLEEFVYRWFMVEHLERLVPSAGAIVLSALFFTLHHVIALAVQFDWAVTVLGSIGVFIGGVVWSWLYVRYRSIWPAYLSHAIVDVAVFAVAARIIFGG